jgi:hypothetical protein
MSKVFGAHAGVTNFVHVGLVVEGLDDTVRFLALLGFDCGKPGVFSGEWIDRLFRSARAQAGRPSVVTCDTPK